MKKLRYIVTMLALLITGALPMQAQTTDSTGVEKLDAVVTEKPATDTTEDVDVNRRCVRMAHRHHRRYVHPYSATGDREKLYRLALFLFFPPGRGRNV